MSIEPRDECFCFIVKIISVSVPLPRLGVLCKPELAVKKLLTMSKLMGKFLYISQSTILIGVPFQMDVEIPWVTGISQFP